MPNIITILLFTSSKSTRKDHSQRCNSRWKMLRWCLLKVRSIWMLKTSRFALTKLLPTNILLHLIFFHSRIQKLLLTERQVWQILQADLYREQYISLTRPGYPVWSIYWIIWWNVITNHFRTEILQVVLLDFRSMKKIIDDANRAGWNHLLPEVYRFLQESETRFGTHYQVAERFLKAAPEIYSLLDSSLRASARALFSVLKKTSNINGTITGDPAIEAVFDAFLVAVDCNERFEVS